MSDLTQFDVSKKTAGYRQDIFSSLKDIMTAGIKEFASSVGIVISAPSSGKNQISKDLSRYERKLRRSRGL